MKAAVIALTLAAGGGPSGGGHGGQHKPPPEAYTACESKSEGASCTVTHGDHSMTGTCRKPPSEDTLVCMPDGPPPDKK